jgi:NIPSNAP protein
MFKNALVVLSIVAAAVLAARSAQGQSRGPVYELRTYTTVEGRLPALLARFRDHTIKLFEKHGMVNVGYWVPADPPKSQNTLCYILKHKSREAATASWDAFRQDPAWLKVQKESEASGKIVDKIESVFMSPTDFSKLK